MFVLRVFVYKLGTACYLRSCRANRCLVRTQIVLKIVGIISIMKKKIQKINFRLYLNRTCLHLYNTSFVFFKIKRSVTATN